MSAAEDAEAARGRLRKFNPFVVGLRDRDGTRANALEFYDGKDRLVRRPLAEFDGRPLTHGRRYFLPAIGLVMVAVVSPLLPFYRLNDWTALLVGIALFVIAAAVLGGLTAYHLNNIRKDYASANRELMVNDFLIKAQGIRRVVRMLKIVVRWRRFLRYTFNVGIVSLLVVTGVSIYGHAVNRSFERREFFFSLLLGAVGFVFVSLFEVVRAAFTQGMDPTLALVLMIEDAGAQLLACRRPANLVQAADGGR
jgi:hypothetical protein